MACKLIEAGHGSQGSVAIRVEKLVTGLEVPWGIAFLPDGSFYVTERPGRVRLVRGGALVAEPVATPSSELQGQGGEGGLMGIALHPSFASNRYFFVYYTFVKAGRRINRVERYQASKDYLRAQSTGLILDDVPSIDFHSGGRLRFGPDGMLYLGTGDAGESANAQDDNSLAGKVLRMTPEGRVPADNPLPGSLVYLSGVRNVQGFDWLEPGRMVIADHGPSGEMEQRGQDELTVARAGDNLGWPDTLACGYGQGVTSPALVWREATPPGGVAFYRGDRIPRWKGSVLITTLRSKHLQHVSLDPISSRVISNDVYLQGDPPGGFGRLRDIVEGPDGYVYVSTSNCDTRGTCPEDKDYILRIGLR